MAWTLADPLVDVDGIVDLADSHYGTTVDGIMKRSRDVFRHRVTVAATEQIFNKYKEFLAVNKTLGEPVWEQVGDYVNVRTGAD